MPTLEAGPGLKTAAPSNAAVDWHLRLLSPGASAYDWVAFEHWLELDPRNARAALDLDRLLADLAALSAIHPDQQDGDAGAEDKA